MARLGPLLKNLLQRVEARQHAVPGRDHRALALRAGDEDGERLRLVVQFSRTRPRRGETWPEYRERVDGSLQGACDRLAAGQGRPLYLANALACAFRIEDIAALAARDDIETVELDPLVDATLMNDAIEDVGLARFRERHGSLTGAGVRVAVLDSGIDREHPALRVAESVSTCAEAAGIPGLHGTHCAGVLASRDAAFPGIAPDATLVDVKVLGRDGSGRHTDVTKGIDAALDLECAVLSLSVGFNHLPEWSDGGHGWHCPDGRCPLCTAVDNANAFGAIVCAAAGNEHTRAETLRRFGQGASLDTELCCPGQSRGAICVAALTKRTFLPAGFSSRGPSAWGAEKPDLSAPGVNLTSTVPVPRLANRVPVANPTRSELFARASGTSVATPLVAGAVALLVQAQRQRGAGTSPAAIRKLLLGQAVSPLGQPRTVVGAGRLDFGAFGANIA